MFSSYPALCFGVELEFLIACVWPNEAGPVFNEERQIRFEPEEAVVAKVTTEYLTEPLSCDKLFNQSYSHPVIGSIDRPRRRVMMLTIQEAVGKALFDAGLPIDIKEDSILGDLSKWEVENDISIQPPDDKRGYEWMPIEIKSPAYEFTPENVAAVKKVCGLLRTKYITNTNESTGLHVHISFGLEKMWEFCSLKNVLMFFWAFHHQFDTLHPGHRQENVHCRSMREKTQMRYDFFNMHNQEMTPIHGLVYLQRMEDMKELCRVVLDVGPSRYMAYNVKTILDFIDPNVIDKSKAKPTIEFRQHKGTLNGEDVTQWIKLLCGVIKWTKTVEPSSLLTLLGRAEHEKWFKSTSPADNAKNREKYSEPILAEGNFTIIHLLEHMGLQDSANFCRGRLHEVVGYDPLYPVSDFEYVIPDSVVTEIDRPVQETLAILRQARDGLVFLEEFHHPEDFHWNPDHPMWPAKKKEPQKGE